jgi:hypothetical protein
LDPIDKPNFLLAMQNGVVLIEKTPVAKRLFFGGTFGDGFERIPQPCSRRGCSGAQLRR